MNFPHLFQLLGARITPPSIRRTMLEQFGWCQRRFSGFYRRTADAVLQLAASPGLSTIVELGAGDAPLTDILTTNDDAGELRFVVCDLIPNVNRYRALEAAHPSKVTPIYEPVDLSQARDWGNGALLVLSAAFHHLPRTTRRSVLASLCRSAGGVLITAPMNRSLAALGQALLGPLIALLLPLLCRRQPGTLRRIFWCWLVPLVPLFILWDGAVGWSRQWTDAEWREAIGELQAEYDCAFESEARWQMAAFFPADKPTAQPLPPTQPAAACGEGR